MLFIDGGFGKCDKIREDSKVHNMGKQRKMERIREKDRERGRKYGCQMESWHPAIVLAQRQQVDGQLAVSSGQVELNPV